MAGKIKTEVVCLSTKAIRRLSRMSKAAIWRSFPTFSMRFYRRIRLRNDSIVLLIHEGLGDLASMAAAIKELSKQHKEVYVVAQRKYFKAISLIFDFDINVRNISAVEGKTRTHQISTQRLLELKQYGYVIKVGAYDSDPIFRYPDSFYIKVGCPPSLAKRRFPFLLSKYRSAQLEGFLEQVGQKFVFFSNETSTGCLDSPDLDKIEPSKRIITFADCLKVRDAERFYDISKLNNDDFTRSLLNSIYTCYLAEYVMVSDAGLFNVLIRLENSIDVRVIWRNHPHSLNKEIYGKYLRRKL
jgi:hypothetical protein